MNFEKRVSLYNESHTQTSKNCFGDLGMRLHVSSTDRVVIFTICTQTQRHTSRWWWCRKLLKECHYWRYVENKTMASFLDFPHFQFWLLAVCKNCKWSKNLISWLVFLSSSPVASQTGNGHTKGGDGKGGRSTRTVHTGQTSCTQWSTSCMAISNRKWVLVAMPTSCLYTLITIPRDAQLKSCPRPCPVYFARGTRICSP